MKMKTNILLSTIAVAFSLCICACVQPKSYIMFDGKTESELATSEMEYDLSEMSVIAISLDEHYGEGVTDSRNITVTKDNDKITFKQVDYGKMESVEKEITLEEYEKIVDKTKALTLCRTYETAPSEIWSYAMVECDDENRIFFNDQSQVKEIIKFIDSLHIL